MTSELVRTATGLYVPAAVAASGADERRPRHERREVERIRLELLTDAAERGARKAGIRTSRKRIRKTLKRAARRYCLRCGRGTEECICGD